MSMSSCLHNLRFSRPALTRALAGGRTRRPVARQTSINSGSHMIHEEQGAADANNDATLVKKKSLVGGNVHGSYNAKRDEAKWLKRPLFARVGQTVTFTGGEEASRLLIDEARRRDPYQADFLHAVEDIATDIAPTIDNNPRFAWIFKQLMEPELMVTFRVPWQDDEGNARINRGYRVQYSSALGQYRGGLRFHPHMSHGSTRMLGLEQTFKNALTGYGFGGSKGGSDFDPTNRSPKEIQRFCESFMHSLARFVGPGVDTLEGGHGVGPSELATMYQTYLREGNSVSDTTALFGSVEQFPEASGFGSVYLAKRTLEVQRQTNLEGKRCAISGSGRLALSTARKLIENGAKVVSLSNTSGYLHEPEGFTLQALEQVMNLRQHKKGLDQFTQASPTTKFVDAMEGSLWENVEADLAFPCLIHGELNSEDAEKLSSNGCIAVFENTDNACTATAKHMFQENNVTFVPSKMVSIGSVVASGTILSSTTPQQVTKQMMDETLQKTMTTVHDVVEAKAQKFGQPGNLKAGANITAFERLAETPMYSAESRLYSSV